jgi:SAM-dependent methyltransferase
MTDNFLIRFLKNQSFQPGVLSVFLNPFFFIRRGLYLNIRSLAPQLKGRLLDFGCGRKPFENLFTVEKYIGVDIEQSGHDHSNSKVDVFYDGKTIPFPNENFDSLFCTEVIEHLFEPDALLQEMNRVLKPGARALFTVPFCWNEHEVPYDYGRYSSFGITHLLNRNGFKVVTLKKSGNFARVVLQLTTLYIFEVFRPLKRFGYLLSLLFITPLNLIGSLLLLILPKNQSMYFNNVILAEKTTSRT